VARRTLDLEAYHGHALGALGKGAQTMRMLEHKARKGPKRVVYGEGARPSVIRAAHEVAVNGVATPILLGHTRRDAPQIKELGLDFGRRRSSTPCDAPKRRSLCRALLRQRASARA
jgi:malate dehydrogenase (oxaloacetate-decarboxylating)(NADP+)